VRPVLSMDARSWSAAHAAAFTFLGGVPARLVIDNLGTGVTRADLYDPRMNRAHAELAAHFSTLIDPARRQRPGTSRAWNDPCPTSRTASGPAASGRASATCRRRRSARTLDLVRVEEGADGSPRVDAGLCCGPGSGFPGSQQAVDCTTRTIRGRHVPSALGILPQEPGGSPEGTRGS
jgi:hypothetical protein